MKKLRSDGGIKLIDIQTKVETSRAMWLMSLVNNPNLLANLKIVTALVGTQKGGLMFTDLVFTNTFYCNKFLNIPASPFYKEGLKATAKLALSKQIVNLYDEKVFYNPIFTDVNNKTLSIPRRCEREFVFTYGAIADEFSKQFFQLPHKRHLATIFQKIAHFDIHGKAQHTIFLTAFQARLAFGRVTYKNVYEELLRLKYVQHHSTEKWETKFNDDIDWDKVWSSLNNPVVTENVRTSIWEQIHLNSYSTYSYNKWHNKQENCPLCLTFPSTKFHLTHECTVTNNLWKDLEHHLMQISPEPVTPQEKIFGLLGHSPGVILRNWITFLLRHCIIEQESIAYHNKKGLLNELELKAKFNDLVK